jgi:hypothetical protein
MAEFASTFLSFLGDSSLLMGNQYSSTITNGKISLYQPYQLALLLVFFSPVFLVFAVLVVAFTNQRMWKGIFFVIWVMSFSAFRNFLFLLFGAQANPLGEKGKQQLCDDITYGVYGNATMPLFIMAFTASYICAPMIVNNVINYWVLVGFIFYIVLDVSVRLLNKCTKMEYAFLDFLLGLAAGIVAIISMYSFKAYDYIFFNEFVQSRETCSVAASQNLKCKVYRNGELLTSQAH